MEFWKIAFDKGWIDAEKLKQAVKHKYNEFGEITPDQYKIITGLDFVIIE